MLYYILLKGSFSPRYKKIEAIDRNDALVKAMTIIYKKDFDGVNHVTDFIEYRNGSVTLVDKNDHDGFSIKGKNTHEDFCVLSNLERVIEWLSVNLDN